MFGRIVRRYDLVNRLMTLGMDAGWRRQVARLAVGASGRDGRAPRVLDVATGKWSTGPELPGNDRVAFSPAAAAVNGRLVVNTSAGPVYRLTEKGDAWEKVGEAATKRIVARLVPFGNDAVILVGGAAGGANADSLEVIKLAEKGEPVAGE